MPATVLPSTLLNRPLVLAGYLVASSAKFQELVGAANAEEARQHTYWNETFDNINVEGSRPRAIATYSGDFSGQKAGRDVFSHSGTIELSIELLPDPTYQGNLLDEATDMGNKFGAILEQMLANAGKGDSISGYTHLNVVGYSVLAGPDLEEMPEDQRFHAIVLGLRWAN